MIGRSRELEFFIHNGREQKHGLILFQGIKDFRPPMFKEEAQIIAQF